MHEIAIFDGGLQFPPLIIEAPRLYYLVAAFPSVKKGTNFGVKRFMVKSPHRSEFTQKRGVAN